MARPWESALHFEPTISYATLHLVCPKFFVPGGRAVRHSAISPPAHLLYPTHGALFLHQL